MLNTPSEQLGAVTRGLRTTQRDGETMRVLTAERIYDATAEEVWDALTTAERIPRWFGPVSGDLRLGGRFQLEGNAGGEILLCEPPRTLAVTWEFGGQVSWVDVTLDDVDDGTRLLLEHTAMVGQDMWDEFGPGAVGIGWEMALMGLAEHLGSPDTPRAELEAWMAGPEGRAYLIELMTSTSEAWARASIDFGTEPAAARAAAERCTAAYTATPEES